MCSRPVHCSTMCQSTHVHRCKFHAVDWCRDVFIISHCLFYCRHQMACLLNQYLVIGLRGFVLMPRMQYWEYQVHFNLLKYQ